MWKPGILKLQNERNMSLSILQNKMSKPHIPLNKATMFNVSAFIAFGGRAWGSISSSCKVSQFKI